MDEKIVGKIKKLLALSQSDNDHESHAALAMAQKLMAEYKISEKDVADTKKRECVTKKTAYYFTTGGKSTYITDLADIIANNFCCINFFRYNRGSKKKFICFMGLDGDVDLCEEAMNVALNAITSGYNKVWKSLQEEYEMSYIPTSIWNPAKKGYIEGYLKGLSDVFEEQKKEHQEWGLVLVVPKEAEDFAASLKGFDVHKGYTPMNYSYYDEGYQEGRRFNMNKKIKNGTEYLLEE